MRISRSFLHLMAMVLLAGCPSPQKTTPTTPPIPQDATDVMQDSGADDAPDSSNTTDTTPTEDIALDIPPPPPPPPTYIDCDAGHLSWVKQALPILLGRRATGIHEVRLLAQIAEKTGRRDLALTIMEDPLFEERWANWLMDEVRINRDGDKKHSQCYGAPMLDDDTGQLAAFIRDNVPLDSNPETNFNMTDVLLSSLRLDDLTPFYRAHLFAMMAKPITGANVAALEMDITRRQDFGEIFEATYLHRSSVCATCHNSAWSTTDSADPATDYHWPIAGLFEKGVYGASSGRPEMDLFTMFRHLNVVRKEEGVRPWSMHESCGRFNRPENIPTDPVEIEAFFIVSQGLSASMWDTEAALQLGIESLRYDGLYVNPNTLEIEGNEAFAYMLSVRIANRVWREVFGYPLTLVHYFPRNKAQRDILIELTNHFIAEGWSLKTLLADILTHPLFNETAPIDGCGPDHPYLMPPVFNPWTDIEPIENEQGNSVGDIVHRYNARVMLSMAEHALHWKKPTAYPEGDDKLFQKSIGIFLKDGEPGFSGVDFQGLLSWETKYGACSSQAETTFQEGPLSCVGKCGDPGKDGDPCYCDSLCEEYGDCCDNYQALCVEELEGNETGGEDWISKLIATAQNYEPNESEAPIQIQDLAASIKDRLISTPDIVEWEEQILISALFGAASLDTAIEEIDNVETKTRALCGILLQSPQYLLTGIAPPDQVTSPRLIINNETYQSRCEFWATSILKTMNQSVTCESNSVSIQPIDPPKTDEPAE